MEDKKTVFNYIGQMFSIYGVMIMIFIVINLIIGNEAGSVSTLFSTDTSDMDFLVMRQILRETAESSQHYECGIGAEIIEGVVNIKMTLPQI